MGEVLPFTGQTTNDIPPEQVLRACADEGLREAIVVGWDANERLWVSSSTSDLREVLWLLERAKNYILTDLGVA